jgi:hypothetical protein
MKNESGKEHKKGTFVNHHEQKHPPHHENKELDDTDKYLALEQPGVSYTKETPILNSDKADFGAETHKKTWKEEGGNSKNSDAFNQDDYLLDDNIDLDEDQNKSISSDDDDFEETNERY